MFNFQGGELVIILLLALVVLGPEKLPDAMRKAGSFYAELRKMSTGFQDEFRKAVDEPVAEMRKTADLVRESADFRNLAEGKRPEKPKSAEMGDASVDTEPDAAAPTFAGAAGTTDTDDAGDAAVPADVEPVDAHSNPDDTIDSETDDRTVDAAPSEPATTDGDTDTTDIADTTADTTDTAEPATDSPPAADESSRPTHESVPESTSGQATDDTIETPKPRKNLIADANAFRPVDRDQLEELRRKAEHARRDYEEAQAELDGNVDP